MAAVKKKKAGKVQKTVHFDDDVWEALEKKLQMSRNSNVSAVVNDAVRYAMFPEYRNDRDADLVKLFHQFSASLADHRKKTARDMAFIQEMMLQSMKDRYMRSPALPEDEVQAREADALARLDMFMDSIVRSLSGAKPLADKE